jgi:hypothetical protein
VDALAPVSRQKREIVAVTMAMLMTIPVSDSSMQVTPRGCRDPAAEGDQGDAGGGVEEMTEASGAGDAGDPNDRRDGQGREDVSDASL